MYKKNPTDSLRFWEPVRLFFYIYQGSYQPSSLNPQPSTLNPQPSTLNPQPSTLHPQRTTALTVVSRPPRSTLKKKIPGWRRNDAVGPPATASA